jgi:RNA polymerase sigma-70 factor (ECF subfamily)
MSLPAPRLIALDGVALTARATTGDAGAFREIYERHAPAVFRFLMNLLGDRGAADEATQETFVRAHGRLGTMRETDKLLPWLFGIARNVCFETRRAYAKTRRDVPEDELDDRVADSPNPEALLLRREADELLSRALQRIPEERRAALLLQMDHGLPYAEIAQILEWSVAKVKIEIHRARLKLRAELSKYLGEQQ